MRLDAINLPLPAVLRFPPMRLAAVTTPTAILLGAVVIAGGIVGASFVPRYQLLTLGSGTFWRLNVATGAVEFCALEHDPLEPAGRQTVRCHPGL